MLKTLSCLRRVKAISLIGIFASFFYILILMVFDPAIMMSPIILIRNLFLTADAEIPWGKFSIILPSCLLLMVCVSHYLTEGYRLHNLLKDYHFFNHVIPSLELKTFKFLRLTYKNAILTGVIGIIFIFYSLGVMQNKSAVVYGFCLLIAIFFGWNVGIIIYVQRGLTKYMSSHLNDHSLNTKKHFINIQLKLRNALKETMIMSFVGAFLSLFYLFCSIINAQFKILDILYVIYVVCIIWCFFHGLKESLRIKNPDFLEQIEPNLGTSFLKHLKSTFRGVIIAGAVGFSCLYVIMADKGWTVQICFLLIAVCFGWNAYAGFRTRRQLMKHMGTKQGEV